MRRLFYFFLLVGLIAVPWDAVAQVMSLSTTNAAGNGQAGCTFAVTAKRNVRIHRIWAQFDPGSVGVEVYTRIGGDTNVFAGQGWVLVADTTITGIANTAVEIPVDLNIILPAGQTQGFYVTNNGSGPSIDYTTVTATTVSQFSDANIEIDGRGWGGSYMLAGTFFPRLFNGRVDYFVGATTNDAGVASIDSVTAACPGNQNIWATIGNYGGNQLDSVTVNWSWNGTVQPPIQLITLLDTFGGTGSTTAPVFLGTRNLAAGATYNLAVWTSNPNGATDTSTYNDTLRTVVGASIQGTFTINSGAATGGSNFNSFGDAVAALNQFGVCGPTIFNVVAGSGPYKEQVTIQPIKGASMVNTITFDGGATQEMIWADASMTSTSDRHVIRLAGADWVRLRNLKIHNYSLDLNNQFGTYGFGLHIQNESDHNIIENCHIDVDTTTGATSSNFGGIIMAGQFGTSTNPAGSHNIIRNNYVHGGYYGITVMGGSFNAYEEDNLIENNIVEEQYYYNIYTYGQYGIKIRDNYLRHRTTGASSTFGYGIYLVYQDTMRVERNTIVDPIAYGIGMTIGNKGPGNVTPSGPAYVINNSISGIYRATTTRGIYVIGNTENTKFYHNSVSVTSGSSTTMAAMYVGTSTTNSGLDVRNNSFAVFGSSSGYALYGGTSNFSNLNYNNYYNDGDTSKVLFLSGAVGLGNMTSAGGFNGSSHHGDPKYVDNFTDLHSKGTQLWDRGNNAVGVSDDIDGNPRPGFGGLIVDIGSDEFQPPQLDVSPNMLASPGLPLCPGTANFSVNVVNFGQATIDTLTVNWWLNGTAQTPVVVNNLGLTAGNSAAISVGSLTIVAGTPYDLTFVTSGPNNGVDEDMSNDTLTFMGLQTGLAAGTYTINSGVATGGTNYTSFQDAVDDLNAFGICGAVVFNVVTGSGPYQEQVTLGEVTGTSSTATITFDGGISKEEIYTDASMTSTSDRHVIRLDGADWVRLRNLSIIARAAQTNTTGFGVGIHMTNEADHNIIEDCFIDVDSGEVASSANFAGIMRSGQFATTLNPAGSHNIIRNNTVHGGYYGITNMGGATTDYEENNVIENNQVIGQYYYNIYNYAQSGLVVRDNFLEHRTTGTSSTFGYGLYLVYQDTMRIEGNTIKDPLGYGIYMTIGNKSPGNNTPSGDANVINNSVFGVYRTTTVRAIYVAGNTERTNFWHNSVSATSGTSTTMAAMYVSTSTTNNGLDIRNNSFAVFNTSAGYAFYGGSNNVDTLDHNNYYNDGDTSRVIFLSGVVPLGMLTTAGGQNANSLHGDPGYVDNFLDVHGASTQLWDAGDNGVGITVDIDGDPRPGFSSTTVDIGSDEFDVPGNDISAVQILEPMSGCGDSLTPVIVVIKNYGTNSQTNFPINVVIDTNGVVLTTMTYTYTATLPLGGQDTVIIGFFNTSAGGTFNVTATTALINDQKSTNDSVSVSSITLLDIPSGPSVNHVTLCAPDSAVLSVVADSGWTYNWYDSTGTLVASDTSSYQTPFLNQTSTYWVRRAQGSGNAGCIRITEINTGGPDMIEIQNLSGATVNATGWTLAVSDAYNNINTVNGTTKTLGIMNAGQIDYWTDGTTNAWGSNLFWNPGAYPTFTGWAVLIDNVGDVVDAVFWNWLATDIANFNVTINGFTITGNDIPWAGNGLDATNTSGVLARVGNVDNDNDTDWVDNIARSDGVQNTGLIVPFSSCGGVGCPSALTAVTATISPPISIDLGPDRAACGSVTLDPGANFNAYSWSTGDTTQTIDAITTATYSVIVTNANGCLGTDTVNLFINPNPVVDLGRDTTVCGSILLDAGNPGADKTWQDGTTKSQTFLATASQQYSVTVIDLNTGCQTIDSITVAVNPLPPVDLGLDRAECDSVVLDVMNPGLDILWSPGGQTSQTISVTTSGQYSVSATDQTTGCAGIDTVNLTISPSPFVDLGPPDTQACDLVILDAGNPGALYDWCSGDLGQTIIVTMTSQHCVTVTDGNGCSGTDTINVEIVGNPVAAYNADTTQLTVDFTNMSTGGGLTYQWSFGDGGTSNLPDPSHTYANTGVYTVQLIVTNACGSDTITTTVTAIATGLDAAFFDGKLSMFPNPTKDIVNFRTEGLDADLQIAIYDVRGRLVHQGVVRRFDQDRLTKVDLSGHAEGVYTVYFEADDHKLVQKLVLK